MEIDIRSWQQARREISGRVNNLKPLMLNLAEIMHAAVLRNFAKESSEGKPWARLAHSTIKDRTRKGYTGKKLQRTGQLKKSITAQYGEDYAEVGTNLIYAAVQNYSAVIHRTNLKTYLTRKNSGKYVSKPKANKMSSVRIPARPFLTLEAKTMLKIERTIKIYLTKI